jgi:hypothetical protein
MRLVGFGALALHRVVLLALSTAIVIAALLAGKSYHSSLIETGGGGRLGADASVPERLAKTEEISFVASPTIEENPKFFFGAGDGSNGYYSERPKP